MGQDADSQAEISPTELLKVLPKTLANQFWRLNNLYHIETKDGRTVLFNLNESQQRFYWEMWYLNVILKARQLGFSTLIDIFLLDVSLFNPGVKCGIIDATIDDAKKKLNKIKFAYDRLPVMIRQANPLVSINASELGLLNGSSIYVGTSHRGGTLQYLHVSELGRIAANYPEKAREIRTGALNTIQAGQFAFIESTAEGQDGDFYNMCQVSEAKARNKSELTPLDFKFHFHAWHNAKEYTLSDKQAEDTIIPPEIQRYFAKLEETEGIVLTKGQKAWYVKKKETQEDDMKREYPATSAEAFEASIKGAIFGDYMVAAQEAGRIGKFPFIPGHPVHTFWDIGRKDYTSIWFAQVWAGKVRAVWFYQNCLNGMPHYAEYVLGTDAALKIDPEYPFKKKVAGIFADKGWQRGYDIFPHDAEVIEWGSNRSRIEQLIKVGFRPEKAVNMSLHDGINAARATINITEFDAEGCAEGLKVLRLYKWEHDEKTGGFRTGVERHDINSHGAAAFRYLGTSHRELPPELPPAVKKPEYQTITTNDDGSLKFSVPRASDIIEIRKRLKQMERRT